MSKILELRASIGDSVDAESGSAGAKKYFAVCIDACIKGLGRVLMQEGNFICYESQKLKEHENNYTTHDLELVETLHALKVQRHYVMGGKF